MIITPSILTDSAEDAFRQVKRLSPFFNYFQIDIADGKFVENTTVSMEEIVHYILSHSSEKHITQSNYDFHLMVKDYESDMKILETVGHVITIRNVFIHIQLKPDYAAIKKEFSDYVIGLVFNPEDDVQYFSTLYLYDSLDVVQVMSVIPGKQGQSFIPDSLYKFEQLRNLGYRNKIFLDGGINKQTLSDIFKSEVIPDGIGPGSYLSKAENIEERVLEIKELFLKAGVSLTLRVK